MIESLIFPSCRAAAQARLIAATLAFGSRPNTSSTKADFTGPVRPSRPSGCVGASSALDAPSPLVRFEEDLALPLAAVLAVAPSALPSAPRLPDSLSRDRVLLTRLSLTESSFPADFHARLTAAKAASGSMFRKFSTNAVLPRLTPGPG